MTGLLQDLEVSHELQRQLEPFLTRLTPIDFRGSVFIDASNFLDVRFAGAVDFSRCRFRSRTWFDGAKFPENAYFTYTHFDKDVSFGSTFCKEARFDHAIFSSYAIFGSSFSQDTWFDAAKFESWVSLSLRSGVRVRLDNAQVSTVILGSLEEDGGSLTRPDSAEQSSYPHSSPPLVTFHGTTFAPAAEVRTRGDVDVSLATVVLRHPLSLACWQGNMRLVSLRQAILEAPLVIGDGVELGGCRMTHASGLDRLRIVGAAPKWRTYRRRQVVADEVESVRHADVEDLPRLPHDVEGEGIRQLNVNAKTVEAIYRQLRFALETSKASAAAADFYYGEMEMRRLAAPRLSTERAILVLYKLTAGYGVRASRALATYLAVLLLAGAALRYQTAWFVAEQAKVAASSGLRFNHYWDSVAIAVRNSVSFFGGISEGLTAAGTALMFVLRLVGPAAFALMILALRSRVQR
jgi:hypothetical protein